MLSSVAQLKLGLQLGSSLVRTKACSTSSRSVLLLDKDAALVWMKDVMSCTAGCSPDTMAGPVKSNESMLPKPLRGTHFVSPGSYCHEHLSPIT